MTGYLNRFVSGARFSLVHLRDDIPKDILWYGLKLLSVPRLLYQQWYNFNGKFTHIDRSSEQNQLCMIIAGYDPKRWDVVFNRVSKYTPKGIDVCIVSPGLNDDDLASIAERHDWSYISTKLSFAR
jgi:hypothetical protein